MRCPPSKPMPLQHKRCAADALIERLQALGLAPDRDIHLNLPLLPEWAFDMLTAMEAIGAFTLTECILNGMPVIRVQVDAAALPLFSISKLIKGM